jgi:hypothetical protein
MGTVITSPPGPFSSGDIIDVIWYNDTLPLDQMWVGIRTRNNVTWKKELVAWHNYYGRVSSIEVEGRSREKWMKIYKADCFTNTDTLVLRKAETFGWMVDKYNLGIGYNLWKIFGGKRLLFSWRYD